MLVQILLALAIVGQVIASTPAERAAAMLVNMNTTEKIAMM